jgi:hypothetical protein
MVTILPVKKKVQEYDNPNKVVVISTDPNNINEKHYCLMCQYSQGRYDSIMKYHKNEKVWRCCVCRYEIDTSLNQTPKSEQKPTIENDYTITKPCAIPLKNFGASAQFQEEASLRPKPKYSSATEAWRADDK